MIVTLLLAAAPAQAATEVGTDKKLGVGVATGVPFANVTGKYWLTDKSGLAVYAGTTFAWHSVRVAYQGEIHRWGESWSFGELPLYWHAGADIGLWTVSGYTGGRIGFGGGVGVALAFAKVPAEVFVETGLGIYPVNGYCSNLTGSALCYVGGVGSAGGRWYF